jgi:hypothetical protein
MCREVMLAHQQKKSEAGAGASALVCDRSYITVLRQMALLRVSAWVLLDAYSTIEAHFCGCCRLHTGAAEPDERLLCTCSGACLTSTFWFLSILCTAYACTGQGRSAGSQLEICAGGGVSV